MRVRFPPVESVDRGHAMPSDPGTPEPATPTSIVVRLERRKHTLEYHAGDTVLETARRGGLHPPSSCEAGDCATCMAHLDAGTVHMRANQALTAGGSRRRLRAHVPVDPDERGDRRRLRLLTVLPPRSPSRTSARIAPQRVRSSASVRNERVTARGTATRGARASAARLDAGVAVGAERQHPDREVGHAGVAERLATGSTTADSSPAASRSPTSVASPCSSSRW